MKHIPHPSRTVGAVALALAMSLAVLPEQAAADNTAGKVILNGTPVPVYFNDGDSFRVLEGRLKGAKARLVGFNTLESHGPVHSWGTWTAKELYVLAKMATLHARRGVWECKTDGNTDTYGRMLVSCPGLAADQIRHGFAHALTVTDDPAAPELLAAQREAIAARRGIWAHGVPAFVLTSLHSVEEDTTGRGTYNRLVSTEDGHSVMWKHDNRYTECQKVCHMEYSVDEARIPAIVAALTAEKAAAELIAGLSAEDLTSVVRDYARFRHINRKVAKDKRQALAAHLAGYVQAGQFGTQTASEGACMVHVDFKRRYGRGKAACLK
jgi:endonuclease YncB( thermonuclease family)